MYANTKRQKRKLEKMALVAQPGPVVWMPNGSPEEEEPSHSSHTHSHSATSAASASVHQPNEPLPGPSLSKYSSSSWDVNAIDPRLFSISNPSSSELAGALTYPPVSPRQQNRQHGPHSQQLPAPLRPVESNKPYVPPMAALLPPERRLTSTPPPSSSAAPSTPTPREISGKGLSEAAAELGGTSQPLRYCSVKGCKAIVPGNSFFRMCEPCRDRYRTYGTTKRAKWRREKDAAVAEMEKLREEENERRASRGLSVRIVQMIQHTCCVLPSCFVAPTQECSTVASRKFLWRVLCRCSAPTSS